MVTLLSSDMKSKYEYLEVCTAEENSDLHPRDYSSAYRNTPQVGSERQYAVAYRGKGV